MSPEHRLQAAYVSFVARVVTEPHELWGFDRSKSQHELQHLLEANRGIRPGTPDTMLERCVPFPNIWIELKWGNNKPTETQTQRGVDIVRRGHVWEWTNSVEGCCRILRAAGVQMHPRAELLALDFDLRVAAKVASPLKPKRSRKPSARVTRRGLAVSAMFQKP